MDPFDLLVGVARGDLPVVEPRIAARFEPREGADGFSGLLEEQALVEAAPAAGSRTPQAASPAPPGRAEASRHPPPSAEHPPAPMHAEEATPGPTVVETPQVPRETDVTASHVRRETRQAVTEPASSTSPDRNDAPPAAGRAASPVVSVAPVAPAILARTVAAEPAPRAAEAERKTTPREAAPQQPPAVTIRIAHLEITAPPEPRRAAPARPLPSRQPAETLEAYLARRRQGRW